MDNNYLFLAMQTGGQLSPEQLQRAQQMGQLPQMGMGAGLTDIQKMNMQQAEHYGMFRRGGMPAKYAQGGEQEEIDQQYLSPYTQYNQRVSEFLQNLRSTAMGALQDEMVDVNDDYAQEAEQIEMEQAQYGQEVSQATINPQGVNAANAWTQAAQNTKDLTQPLAQTAGLATGLKGYWGDQAAYEANPFNSKWNPTRLTLTDKQTGEKTVTRAGKDGFNYGGQYFQPGGESNPGDYYANGDPEATDANGNLKPGYVTFTGVPKPMAGAPMTPFSGIGGLASQVAGLVRTGKTISDLLPSPSATSTGVGPFTGNVGAPATASGTPTFGGITPNFYSAGLQGGKSQMATGQAMDAYGDQGRANEAAYNAQKEQERVKAQQAQVEKNAIAMGWVKPDGTADVEGYSSIGPNGKQWEPKPGFNPNAALPTSLDKKDKKKEKKDAGSSTGTQTGTTGAGTTGTSSEAPTGTEVVKNADGTESSISPQEVEKRKTEAAAQTDTGTTTTTPAATNTQTTTTQPKTGTGEIDYLASLADPMGQNAGGVYRTDSNGNPVPMAFYDPNMRLTGMKADYRNNAASWFRRNKRPGQMKSLSFDFTTGNQSPATQVPNITLGPNPNAPEGTQLVTNPDGTESSISPEEAARRQQIAMGMPEGTTTITNPDGTQSSVAPDFYERNFPAPNVPTWDPSQFIPKYNAPSPSAIAPQAPQQPAAPQPMSPGAAWNPQDFLPTSLRAAQQAPLNAQQQAQLAKLSQGAKPKRNGGQYFQPGGQILGLEPNPQMDMGWAPMGQADRKPEDRVSANVQMSQDFNKQMYGEPLKINDTNSFTAKYDKNKKDNPFFAPAMLAGLNLVAGATENADAARKAKQARGKFGYDQIYTANPETSGSRGDWTFNEGYMRPNDMVPTQFTGAGAQMQWGGAYSEGDELYLDEDAIQAFLAAGGQLDYLD